GQLRQRLRAGADQVLEGNIHGLGDLAQADDGNVPISGFQLGQIALRNARVVRQDLARHPAAHTQVKNALAELAQELVIVDLRLVEFALLDAFDVHRGNEKSRK